MRRTPTLVAVDELIEAIGSRGRATTVVDAIKSLTEAVDRLAEAVKSLKSERSGGEPNDFPEITRPSGGSNIG